MKKKKIMIIHHSGSIGGAGVSVYNTVITLKDIYEIVIYCPAYPNDFSKYLLENSINVKTYDFPIGSIHYYSGGSPLFSPGFLKGIVNIFRFKNNWNEILKVEKPDLVIANSKILAWLSIILRKNNIKGICYVRETRKRSFFNVWNNIQSSLLDKFNGVIFISRYDQEKECLKKAISKIIPNFINIDDYKSNMSRKEVCKHFGIEEDSFNILFVGGMLRIKGFDIAVKSMKYLKDFNIKLIVAGDSEFHYKSGRSVYSRFYNFLKRKYENIINKEITQYNLQNNIVKIGIQNNMADIYAMADVLIFPATTPHQARPVFEAGAMKLPVIMPNFENTLEYVSHGDNGLIFKRKNSKSLAENIKILINDGEYRKSLGEKNYEHTLRQHTKETSEKLLKEIIDSILEIKNMEAEVE